MLDQIMKYQRFTPSSCKDIAILKLEFVAKTQLFWFIYSICRLCNFIFQPCMSPQGTSYMGSLKSASQYGSAVWPAIANKYTNKQINIDSEQSKTLQNRIQFNVKIQSKLEKGNEIRTFVLGIISYSISRAVQSCRGQAFILKLLSTHIGYRDKAFQINVILPTQIYSFYHLPQT